MLSLHFLMPVGHSGSTEFAGILIPSTSPAFLAIVAAHVSVALTAVTAGAAAMLVRKGTPRHRRLGTVYYWALTAAVVLALVLAAMRWPENLPLALLGGFAFVSATLGRAARRGLWRSWRPFHIGGMGGSYILMLTAFYVDNGPNLPLWRDLPAIAYWLLPALVGVPIILWAIARHRAAGAASSDL